MRVPRPFALLAGFTVLAIMLFLPGTQEPVLAASGSDAGSLQVFRLGKAAGFCPLQHTDVKATVSGLIARVSVTQEFANPSSTTIEAVYTFPLPQDAAVDDMTIQIGERTIRGLIKRREEAAKIYAKAIAAGQTAALLDQERPNIFTQSVGNIPPGQSIQVTISYLARLKYEDGSYEFTFPMVVGPRYIPGTQAIGQQGGGFAPDTDRVPDASKVTPPVAPPGTRAGHDISISLTLDAGIPIQDLRSPSHEIDAQRMGATSAVVKLRNEAEIPNKDFILRYAVAGPTIAEGVLTHTAPMPNALASATGMTAQTNGFFTVVIQPPERFPEYEVASKELVFVLDSSGSMGGFPIEKSKRLIDHAIDGLNPGDTFNVIKFSGETAILFKQPVYPTADNVRKAKEFVNDNYGGGGTEMMKAIRASLEPSDASDHVRIVVFLTDGYVGNDMEIIGEIQKHPNARIFAYGIGSSVNRFLLDKMADAGRGVVEYVSQKQDEKEAEQVASRLYERLRAPLLTDIALDFGALPVTDVYPKRIPDLFSARPVVVTGRYTRPAKGTIRLVAKRAGDAYSREIPVDLAAQELENSALASLWAREKIDDLMSQDWAGMQSGNMRKELSEQITQVGLDYRLMTQFTSFVAVEEKVVNVGGAPQRVQVPVELPEGVQYEQGWSRDGADHGTVGKLYMYSKLSAPPAASQSVMVTAAAPMINTNSSAVTYTATPSVSASGGGGGGAARKSKAAPPPANGVGTGTGAGVGPGHAGGVAGGVVGGVPGAVAGGLERMGPPIRDGESKPAPPRPIDTKLHPRLVALFDCYQKQSDKTKALSECKLTSDQITVEVILANDSADALETLKALGFEASAVTRKRRVTGHIAVEKLAALAESSAVKFVAPAASNGA